MNVHGFYFKGQQKSFSDAHANKYIKLQPVMYSSDFI